ncbi:cobalamin biosynthesis protein CbiX [Paenibacillus rhizovicinus]|uniref:Cobalamin biosynthesis protein CbiX n=1 Tax=Paenibacillus rhizovicinus TaxID=2704463 RepID=A0A6C0P472_9BACL|nr:CbiX/SirB N-terminal domain-containing protein [Paenibacillus rhizovicinus]QHW31472.1 cobalamin biosynthesis protein CbiX [Paenibacillus rhizovicinus]
MKPGILVISHGSREADWVRLVDDTVAAVAASQTCANRGANGIAVPVVSAFLEIVEGRLIQDGIDTLAAEGVEELYVLPLFVSSGSTHADDIAQAFGVAPVSAARRGELEPFRIPAGMTVHMGVPIDDDGDDVGTGREAGHGGEAGKAGDAGAGRGGIAGLLLDNIASLSETPARERLLLVAHGSGEPVFHERWLSGMTRLAGRLRALGGFAGADIALLLPDQAAGKLRALQQRYPDDAFIVVPLFLSEGYFTRTVIPKRLDGLAYRYNGRALLPSPRIAEWMERQIFHWLTRLGPDDGERLGS